MRQLLVATVFAAGLLLLSLQGTAEDRPLASGADTPVPTARGVPLQATLHRPEKPNGTAIVLAPGQGYHRGLPLMQRGAEALAGAGFLVLRFDWAYFTAKAQPAEDFGAE